MASQTTCICCVEMPRPFRNERAALAPSTSKRFSAVYRSVKPRSCRIVATANNSASGALSALSESNTPNSQERIVWLKRNGSDALRDKSIASRTRTVSGTLIPAKTIPYLPRFHIVRGRRSPFSSGEPFSLHGCIVEQLHNLVVQIASDCQCFLIPIRSQEAGHLVIGEMNAVFTFIN